jgi:hypothetical protein
MYVTVCEPSVKYAHLLYSLSVNIKFIISRLVADVDKIASQSSMRSIEV